MNFRFVYRSLKARYRDQKTEVAATLAALKPGDTAVDAGANKGAYLYWLRKAVGESGSVFGFEPQPSLAGYLKSIVSEMGWRNVHVHDCALSDSVGTATLHVPGETNSPGASLEEVTTQGSEGHTHECRVDTLDRVLQNATRVALLKVDVEGHELQVFRGAKETIARHRPIIIFECENRHLRKNTMQDVFNFLHGLGYTGEFFSTDGLRPLNEFNPAVHQKQSSERFWDAPDYCNNFLFRPTKP